MSSRGWREVRLGDVCDINRETYSLSENWEYVNYLDTGNITENRIKQIQRFVLGRDSLPSRARRKVSPNSILYSTVRPTQRHFGLVREPVDNMLASTGFAVILRGELDCSTRGSCTIT